MATHATFDITNDANQSFAVNIDGATFDMKLVWQPSDEHWYIDVSVRHHGQNYQRFGRRVIIDEPLIELPSATGLGTIYCRRRSERAPTDVARDAFTTTHDLVYERDDAVA